MVPRSVRFAGLGALALGLAATVAARAADVDVTTYHNDNFRTGWNAAETILKPGDVKSAKFKLLKTVKLDEQVDAQPLIVTQQAIKGHSGKQNVVYVASENNTLYAIDADTGKILRKTNLGTPVPIDNLPGGCDNNSAVVGIGSTPVIDRAHDRIYLISDTFEHHHAVFRLHALSLTDLNDDSKPTVIAASATLTDSSTLDFTADVERQRAALLLDKQGLYAGFASYCDISADQSRGWVMSWNATSLKPKGTARLLNTLATSPDNFFLTSVWMSGSGLAADQDDNVYFVTGNSDPSGSTFADPANLAESAVSLTPNLQKVRTFFTPQEFSSLEGGDTDFGSGGILLLPPQKGAKLNLATALGKSGSLYLLDRDGMGGYTPGGPDQVLDMENTGGCWCAESYFTGADGVNRVVAGGGGTLTTWKIQVNAPRSIQLVNDLSVDLGHNGQNGGFNNAVSSNGEKNAIIWAVGRPDGSNNNAVYLYAFDAKTGAQLTEQIAGTWPNGDADANIVPTVANGKVYVAAYKTLAILGLSSGTSAAAMPVPAPPPDMVGGHAIHGTVQHRAGARITLMTRTGTIVHVDATAAIRAHVAARTGNALLVRGDYDSGGVFHATAILRAQDNPALWRRDR